jgi:molybdopterin/thiamine biosynthesis adenylyltransferase
MMEEQERLLEEHELLDDRISRTVLWMSPAIRDKLNQAKLLVVGCGGTGSLLAVDAAFLGFKSIVICDGDTLEASNLNRFVYAAPADVGRSKAELIQSYIKSHVPEVVVDVVADPFPSQATLTLVADQPVIVAGCVDDVRVRVELDVLCRRFGRTLVDLGTGFAVEEDGRMVGSGGQVLISRPEGPCLMCLGFPQLLNENDYFAGSGRAPEPSLLLLNTIVSSLALDCLLKEVDDNTSREINVVRYSRDQMTLTPERGGRYPGCKICGDFATSYLQSVLPSN